MAVVQRKANVELSGEVVRWVSVHFKETRMDTALAKLRSAGMHTGTGVASPTPLPSHQFARRSEAAGALDPRIGKTLSRRHGGAEYKQEGGKDISGFTISTVLWRQ
jgi:hypothetical protein